MKTPTKRQPKRQGPEKVKMSITMSKECHDRLKKLAEKENVSFSYALEYGVSAWMRLPGRKAIK